MALSGYLLVVIMVQSSIVLVLLNYFFHPTISGLFIRYIRCHQDTTSTTMPTLPYLPLMPTTCPEIFSKETLTPVPIPCIGMSP